LWIDGIPSDAAWTADVEIHAPPAASAAERAVLERVPLAVKHDGKQLLSLFVPVIPAGASGAITLTITVPSDRRFTLRAWADPPVVDVAAAPRVAQARSSSVRDSVPGLRGGGD